MSIKGIHFVAQCSRQLICHPATVSLAAFVATKALNSSSLESRKEEPKKAQEAALMSPDPKTSKISFKMQVKRAAQLVVWTANLLFLVKKGASYKGKQLTIWRVFSMATGALFQLKMTKSLQKRIQPLNPVKSIEDGAISPPQAAINDTSNNDLTDIDKEAAKVQQAAQRRDFFPKGPKPTIPKPPRRKGKKPFDSSLSSAISKWQTLTTKGSVVTHSGGSAPVTGVSVSTASSTVVEAVNDELSRLRAILKALGPFPSPINFRNSRNLCFWHSYLQTTFHQAIMHGGLLDQWESLKPEVQSLITQYVNALNETKDNPTKRFIFNCPIDGLNRGNQEDLAEAHGLLHPLNSLFTVNARHTDDNAMIIAILAAGTNHHLFEKLKAYFTQYPREYFNILINGTSYRIDATTLNSRITLPVIRLALQKTDLSTIAFEGRIPRVDRQTHSTMGLDEIFSSELGQNRSFELIRTPLGRAIIASHMQDNTRLTLFFNEKRSFFGRSRKTVILTKKSLTSEKLEPNLAMFVAQIVLIAQTKGRSYRELDVHLEKAENIPSEAGLADNLTFETPHPSQLLRAINEDDPTKFLHCKRGQFEEIIKRNIMAPYVDSNPSFRSDSSAKLATALIQGNATYKDYFNIKTPSRAATDSRNWIMQAGSHLLVESQVFDQDMHGRRTVRPAEKMVIPKRSFELFSRRLELESFAKHNGSRITGGHWIAYRKVDSQWYELDDCRGVTAKTDAEIDAILNSNGKGYQVQHTFYSIHSPD